MVSIESQVMPGAAVTGVALVMTGDGRWSRVPCCQGRLLHVLGVLNTFPTNEIFFFQSTVGLSEHDPVLSLGPSSQLGLLFSEEIEP